ncbi:peptidase [Aureococcus anophagefferens]|nr:peptidase [Aureococcus anophagefferens]
MVACLLPAILALDRPPAAIDASGTYIVQLCADADEAAVRRHLARARPGALAAAAPSRRGAGRLSRHVHAAVGRPGRRSLVVGGLDAAEAGAVGTAGVCRVEADAPVRKAATNWGLEAIAGEMTPLAVAGAGATIVVVDTGLDAAHCEFAATGPSSAFNQWRDGSLGTNVDGDGHGTHVAALAAGRSVGVASGADVLGVKTLSDDGAGTVALLVEALDWVVRWHEAQAAPKTTIVNLSLEADIACGGPCESSSLYRALEDCRDAGVVAVVAAGNAGEDACAYATSAAGALDGVIVVSSHDDEDRVDPGDANTGPCVDRVVAQGGPAVEGLRVGAAARAARAVGDDGTYGFEACPAACLACAARYDGCGDAESWHKKSAPAKDCAWVARDAGPRCAVKGGDGAWAWQSCPAACGICP